MTSKIMALIKAHQRIFVYRHINPDPDAIGSQAGLVRLLQHSFPKKEVVAVGSPSSSLAWISAEMGVDRLPGKEDLVIVVDCANRTRIDGPLPVLPTIKIDHHPNLDPYAQVNWVDDKVASCAEMIYQLYRENADELKFDLQAASDLYAGIIGDTVGFSTADTTADTFQTAADLRRLGVDVAEISHQVTAIDSRLSKLFGFVMSNLEVNRQGLGSIVIPQTVLKSYGLSWGEEDAVVSLPGNLKDVQVWLMFIESPQGEYRVHLRSKKIPIDRIARDFAGGGHPLASGTYVKDLQTAELLINATNKLMIDQQTNSIA
ncbi:DHH family phosphoesterase [Pediococcus siamensis]|uniref:DHH family phosphoesterase n=1 Tax=Pediococcus siamensis TaxID=381829 RepID=UPI00399F1014